MRSGKGLNMRENAIGGPGFAVRPVRSERIPYVDDREYPSGEGYFIAFQSLRITGAVPFFMVAIRDIERRAEEADRGEHPNGEEGVLSHLVPLRFGECSWLEKNTVWDSHFTNVM